MNTNFSLLYEEKLSSPITVALFIALALTFLMFTLLRVNTHGVDGLSTVCAVLFTLFLFYSLNYRTLIIRILPSKLKLQFGVFSWTVPIKNIVSCEPDNDLSLLMKYGGAGIHFMMVDGCYRVSFNFLEYDRIVIRLKEKQGLVMSVSFSTQQPQGIIQTIQKMV